MVKYLKHIMTPTTCIVHTSKGVKSVNKGHPNFDVVRQAIKDKDFETALDHMDIGRYLYNASNGEFTLLDGQITYNGKSVPAGLSNMVIKFIKEKAPYKYLLNFWDLLSRNPSKNSREQLFGFLNANKVSITEDGHFITYKIVSSEFKSLHNNLDGTYNDNSPGKTVRMRRELVDPNPNVTCSRGLHVCEIGYTYDCYNYKKGEDNRKLIECKVNPRHVVAIPTDYQNKKIRLCEYEVLNEHRPHKGDKASDDCIYSFRTYYYKSPKGKLFNRLHVVSKKPSRFYSTVRAKTIEEAAKFFEEDIT